MIIGFDAKRAFVNRAGLGNYSRNTLASLNKYFPQHSYVLFTSEFRTKLFKEYPLFDIVAPASRFCRIFGSYWRSFVLTRKLRERNIQLFHGLSNELPAGIHKTGIPSVVTIHDLIFMSFPMWYKRIDRRIYLEKVKYACANATKIIAISESTRKDLIRQLDVDPSKIEVIYQSISERFFFNSVKDYNNEVLAKFNLPEHYLLTVGTVEPRKNHLAVLKAIHQYNLDIAYVIVGKATPYKDELVKYITLNRLGNKVYFLHDVSDSDIPSLYQQATCMVYLSHYEGFGLPVVEAMASGCPVIASSVSCLPEIGAEAALYCDPNDEAGLGQQLIDIMGSQELTASMKEKGKKRAQFFHPENRVNALMRLYMDLVPE